MFRDEILRGRDVADHALIGFLRRFTKSKNAMLVEDQSLDGRVGLEHFGSHLGEVEARLDIWHESHRLAEYLARQRFAVRLIDDGENGGRMSMVDEFMRQEGMQQRLA